MNTEIKEIIERFNLPIIIKKKTRYYRELTSIEVVKAIILSKSRIEAALLLNVSKGCLDKIYCKYFSYIGSGRVPKRNQLLSSIGRKYCYKCEEIKFLIEFYNYESRCKNCNKIQTHKYREGVLIATPKWADISKINKFYKNANGYHVDHIIPLKGKNVCGLHVIENLQYLTKEENLIKSNNY